MSAPTSTSLTTTSITTTTTSSVVTSNTSTGSTLQMASVPRRTNSSADGLLQPQSAANLDNLSLEFSVKIFGYVAADRPNWRRLQALAQTCRVLREAVNAFYLRTEEGKKLAGELAKAQRVIWNSGNRDLQHRVSELRQSFLDSAARLKGSRDEIESCLATSPGIGVSFAEGPLSAELVKALSRLTERPIKLMAAGIGRERFVKEVLSLVARLSRDCSLVLDASGNDLRARHVASLVRTVRPNRNLVSLDLSDNPLCNTEKASSVLINLLHFESPLYQLYLRNTGINDLTVLSGSSYLRRHSSIVDLDLRDNRLTTSGAIYVTTAIVWLAEGGPSRYRRFNTSLQQIRLQGNPCNDALKGVLQGLQSEESLPEAHKSMLKHVLEVERFALKDVVQLDGISQIRNRLTGQGSSLEIVNLAADVRAAMQRF